MDAPRARTRPRTALRTILVATVATAALALVPSAHALIYWGNGGPGTIGRADLDGTHVDQSFITGGNNVRGVAVDDGHVYWANWSHVAPTGTLGRANLDGTGVDQSFIAGAIDPYALTADSTHLYWGDYDLHTIARANLDGTGVTPSLITGVVDPMGLAVDGAHIYWTNGGAIGRANLDGTGVEGSFITGIGFASEVAVDGAHIYWADSGAKAIGRANLDGTGADHGWISGIDRPTAVAVDDAHIYWSTSTTTDTIGRANLDGTGVEPTLITGTAQSLGLAVDDERYPSADAGPEQTVDTGASVTLDGRGSSDPNGDPLGFAWTQTAGPTVSLSAGGSATPSFEAPADPATLEFRLEACDPLSLCAGSNTTVRVIDPPPVITNLKINPLAFAAAARRAPLTSKAGAQIKLTLSEDARVRFRVRRDPPHRGSGSPPRHRRVFKRSLEQGRNAVAFSGQLGKLTLAPGRYRLITRARDSAGQASKRVRASFEIVR